MQMYPCDLAVMNAVVLSMFLQTKSFIQKVPTGPALYEAASVPTEGSLLSENENLSLMSLPPSGPGVGK